LNSASAPGFQPTPRSSGRAACWAALVLLLVALLLVFIRDRRFWFPSHGRGGVRKIQQPAPPAAEIRSSGDSRASKKPGPFPDKIRTCSHCATDSHEQGRTSSSSRDHKPGCFCRRLQVEVGRRPTSHRTVHPGKILPRLTWKCSRPAANACRLPRSIPVFPRAPPPTHPSGFSRCRRIRTLWFPTRSAPLIPRCGPANEDAGICDFCRL